MLEKAAFVPGERVTCACTMSLEPLHASAAEVLPIVPRTESRRGGATSYAIGKPRDASLPALSRQVPTTTAPGPPKFTGSQAATPDVVSVPENANPTGWFHQPL